jgi:hypothetical protein
MVEHATGAASTSTDISSDVSTGAPPGTVSRIVSCTWPLVPVFVFMPVSVLMPAIVPVIAQMVWFMPVAVTMPTAHALAHALKT